MGTPKSDEKLQTKIITDSGNTYICVSSIGTSETDAKWAITKIDATGNTTYPIRTETGLPTYGFWFLPADVTTLTYSYN